MVHAYSTKETQNTSYMTLQTNSKSPATDWVSSQATPPGSHTLQAIVYGVFTIDNLHSLTVASIFRLASPRSSITLPPLRTAPPALCHLQSTICQSRPMRLSFLLPTSPAFFRRMLRGTRVRTPIQNSARGSRLSTFAIRCMRKLVSAVRRRYFLLCSGPLIVRSA